MNAIRGCRVLLLLGTTAAISLPAMAANPLVCNGDPDPATPTVVEFDISKATCVIRDGTHRLSGGGDLSFAIRPADGGNRAVLEAAMGTDGGRRTGGFQICLLGDGPSGAHCRRKFISAPGQIRAVVETATHRMIVGLEIAADKAIRISAAKVCQGTGPGACG